MENNTNEDTGKEMVLYQIDNQQSIEVRISDDTVWLTQAQIAELFQRDVSVISRHIKNVFKEGELSKESNLHFLQIASSDKPVTLFSLDVIISVGYRVKSKRGTDFRIWANQVLKNYLLRGAVVNQRFEYMENRLQKNEQRVQLVEQKLDNFLQTALPPKQGIFFQGQIFDALHLWSLFQRLGKETVLLFKNRMC